MWKRKNKVKYARVLYFTDPIKKYHKCALFVEKEMKFNMATIAFTICLNRLIKKQNITYKTRN